MMNGGFFPSSTVWRTEFNRFVFCSDSSSINPDDFVPPPSITEALEREERIRDLQKQSLTSRAERGKIARQSQLVRSHAAASEERIAQLRSNGHVKNGSAIRSVCNAAPVQLDFWFLLCYTGDGGRSLPVGRHLLSNRHRGFHGEVYSSLVYSNSLCAIMPCSTYILPVFSRYLWDLTYNFSFLDGHNTAPNTSSSPPTLTLHTPRSTVPTNYPTSTNKYILSRNGTKVPWAETTSPTHLHGPWVPPSSFSPPSRYGNRNYGRTGFLHDLSSTPPLAFLCFLVYWLLWKYSLHWMESPPLLHDPHRFCFIVGTVFRLGDSEGYLIIFNRSWLYASYAFCPILYA